MTEIRTILLVGSTKSGKSALANVLTNSDKFVESNGCVSKTQKIQATEFELDLFENSEESKSGEKIKYLVIDTPGFDNTKLQDNDIFIEIAKIVDKISHVFFVFNGRFGKKETEIINSLEEKKNDEGWFKNANITLIRSRFENFRSEKRCEKDRGKIANENSKIGDYEIIHVDNPSLEGEKYREKSRAKLLQHLREQNKNIHPFVYEDFREKIRPFLIENQNWKSKLIGGGVITGTLILLIFFVISRKSKKKKLTTPKVNYFSLLCGFGII